MSLRKTGSKENVSTQPSSISEPGASQKSSSAAWEEADCVVGEKGKGRNLQYRVKWKGRQENGDRHPDWWLEPQHITEDLIEAWNEVKRQRAVAKRNRKQKHDKQEDDHRERAAEEARKNLHEDRAERMKKRQSLKQQNKSRSLQTFGPPVDVAESPQSQLFVASSLPSSPVQPRREQQPRNRRVVHSPDDSETEPVARTISSGIPSPIEVLSEDAVIACVNTNDLVVKVPEGVSVEDYNTFSSSVAGDNTAAASPEASSVVYHPAGDVENPISFSSSRPATFPSVIPDSQSLLVAEIRTEPPAVQPQEEQDKANSAEQTSSSDKPISAQADTTSVLLDSEIHPQEDSLEIEESSSNLTRSQLSQPAAETTEPFGKLLVENEHEIDILRDAPTEHNQYSQQEASEHVEAVPEPQAEAQQHTLESVTSTTVTPSINQHSQDSAGSGDANISHFESQVPFTGSQPTFQSNSNRTDPDSEGIDTQDKNLVQSDQSQSQELNTQPPTSAPLQLSNSLIPPESVLQDAQPVESYNAGSVTGSPARLEPVSQPSAPNIDLSILAPPLTYPTLATTFSTSNNFPSSHFSSSLPTSGSVAVAPRMAPAIVPARPEPPSTPSSITPLPADSNTNMSPELSAEVSKNGRVSWRSIRKNRGPRTPFKFELESFIKPSSRESTPAGSRTSPVAAVPNAMSVTAHAVTQPITDGAPSGHASLDLAVAVQPLEEDMIIDNPATVVESPTQLNYFIPIQLAEEQKRIYKRAIRAGAGQMQEFLERSNHTTAEIENVSSLLNSAHNACLLTDLVDADSETQDERPYGQQAAWAISNSEKFRFLKELLRRLQTVDCHVVIFVRPGRAIDKVEAFLHGSGVTLNRPDEHRSIRIAPGLCRVTLIPTRAQQIVERADLVIGLDATFDWNDPQVLQVRRDMVAVNKACPAISLYAPYTTEHVVRVLPEGLSEDERFSRTVFTALQIYNLALSPTSTVTPAAEDIAATIARYMAKPSSTAWALPSLEDTPIPSEHLVRNVQTSSGEFSIGESLKRAFEEVDESDAASAQAKKPRLHSPKIYSEPTSSELLKRALEAVDDHTTLLQAKKPRVHSPTIYSEPTSSESLSRVLDSGIDPADSAIVPADSDLVPTDSDNIPADSAIIPADTGIVPTEIMPPRASPTPPTPPSPTVAELLAFALSREDALRAELFTALARQTNLETDLATHQLHRPILQKQITTLEQTALSINKTNDLHLNEARTATKEGVKLKAALEIAETKRTAMATTIATLRGEILTMKAAAEESSKERLASIDPAIHDAEQLTIYAARITELKTKLVNQQTASDRNFQYLREQYENASNAATEHAHTITALEAENTELKTQASGELTKLRGMYMDERNGLALAEIEKVTRERDDLRRLVQQLEAEKASREKKGLGMATRASSLPPRAVAAASVVRAMTGQANGGAGNGNGIGNGFGAGSGFGVSAGHSVGEGGKQLAAGGTAMKRVASALGRMVEGANNTTPTRSRNGSRAGSRVGSRQGTPAK